ncbi:MAG: ATP-binding protein [bacterium]
MTGPSLFDGDGDMRAQCRAFDWAASPLGPVSGWSQSLRTTVATLLASRHPMFLFWGPDLIQIYNDAYRPSLGHGGRAEHALGMRGKEFWTDIWDTIGSQIAQVMGGGPATWFEDQYLPIERNGRIEEVYWTYCYGPVRDDDDSVGGTLVVCQETTNRVVAERNLQRARADAVGATEHLERVIQQAPVAMYIARGRDHVFEVVNEAWYRLAGKRPDEVIGRAARDVFPELVEQGVIAIIERAFDTGVPFEADALTVWIDADGDGAPEEHLFNLVYQPLRDADGAVYAIALVANEVTGLVMARRESDAARAEAETASASLADSALEMELANQQLQENTAELEAQSEEAEAAARALAESEARFRTVQDASPDASLLLRAIRDNHGRITDFEFTYANESVKHILLGTPENVVGRTMREAFPESVAAGRLDHYIRVVETGVPWLEDVHYRRGSVSHGLRVSAVKVDDGVHLAAADLTARIQAAEERERLLAEARTERAGAEKARVEAENANRAKSEFLAVMSHELRTPLNAIGGYAELIELGIHGPVTPEQRHALERIQSSQRHLLGLITAVLNYARVEGGVLTYAREEVPLVETITECEALTAPQMRAKRITFSFTSRDAPFIACADGEKVRQILLNLLGNAVKFTDPDGRITVHCVAEDGVVAVEVEDTGVGIAPEHLARVFDPFVQVDSKLTRTNEGVGLGLAISRDLARGMGGDLTARSTPGVGSVFTLTLPVA